MTFILHSPKCHHCKHHRALMTHLSGQPYFGLIPCPQCVHGPDNRTDKFERVSREQIDKQYRATEDGK